MKFATRPVRSLVGCVVVILMFIVVILPVHAQLVVPRPASQTATPLGNILYADSTLNTLDITSDNFNISDLRMQITDQSALSELI